MIIIIIERGKEERINKYQDLGIQSINIKTNSLVIIRSVE